MTIRILLAGAVLLSPAIAAAQSDADLITEATRPLPPQFRDGATVVLDQDGQRRVLRQGTNSFICHPDQAEPAGYYVSCSDAGLSRSTAMAEYGRLRRQGLPEGEILAAVSAGVASGELTPIPSGAMFYALSGPDESNTDLLVVIRTPDATAAATGLPVEPSEDQAWLMFPGTHQAHIMLGSPPYWWSPNE